MLLLTLSLTNLSCWCSVLVVLTLWEPMDCSLPVSSVHGILQARILEWVAIPFSRGSSQLRGWTWVSCIAHRFFTIWTTREAVLPFSVTIFISILSLFWGRIKWNYKSSYNLKVNFIIIFKAFCGLQAIEDIRSHSIALYILKDNTLDVISNMHFRSCSTGNS